MVSSPISRITGTSKKEHWTGSLETPQFQVWLLAFGFLTFGKLLYLSMLLFLRFWIMTLENKALVQWYMDSEKTKLEGKGKRKKQHKGNIIQICTILFKARNSDDCWWLQEEKNILLWIWAAFNYQKTKTKTKKTNGIELAIFLSFYRSFTHRKSRNFMKAGLSLTAASVSSVSCTY